MGSEQELAESWREIYENTLKRAIDSGLVEILPDHQERRRHPRFRVGGLVQVRESVDQEIIDISLSGVALYTERPYPLEELVHLSFMGSFSIAARVVRCEMEEVDSSFLEYRYKVGCEFLDSEHALWLLTMVLNMNLETDQPDEKKGNP